MTVRDITVKELNNRSRRKWYLKNREYAIELSKQWYLKNREYVLEKARQKKIKRLIVK